MPTAVFEPAITGNQRRQNHASDRAATGSAANDLFPFKIVQTLCVDLSASYASGTRFLLWGNSTRT